MCLSRLMHKFLCFLYAFLSIFIDKRRTWCQTLTTIQHNASQKNYWQNKCWNKQTTLCASVDFRHKQDSHIYKYWYDYVKPKYWEKAKLCYIDPDRIIIYENQKISMLILLEMLRIDLTHLTIKSKDHYT